MATTPPLLCVHAAAFGKDVVFRFAAAKYAIEGGALSVRSIDPPYSDMMSLAPGIWKAAWHEDAHGAPLGLLPESSDSVPHEGSPQPNPNPLPAAVPETVEAQAQAAARAALEKKISDALATRPYESLQSFSAALGEQPGEVERSLISALQKKSVDPERVVLPSVQLKLDSFLPALIATRQPQGVREIMQHLREQPDTRECDYVQLNIWLRRNPSKRGS